LEEKVQGSTADIEEEATDLLREIEKSLRRRRRGEVVRVEVCEHYDPQLLEFVLQGLQAKAETCLLLLAHESVALLRPMPDRKVLRFPCCSLLFRTVCAVFAKSVW